MTYRISGIPQLLAQDLKTWLTDQTKECIILDVREDYEYEKSHIENSHHIPLGQLESSLSHLPNNHAIVCVCAAGRRSQVAAELLYDNGFDEVYNLAGGMAAWHAC